MYVIRQFVKSPDILYYTRNNETCGPSFHTKYFDSVFVCTELLKQMSAFLCHSHLAFFAGSDRFATGILHFCGLCFTTYSGLAAHTSAVIAFIIVPIQNGREKEDNVIELLDCK